MLRLFLNKFSKATYSTNTDFNSTAQATSAESIQKQAVKVFSNILSQRKEITSFLKNKSGIYLLHNKFNGKYYIGSSAKLNRRVNEHFNIINPKFIIGKAIQRYGLVNFELLIIEFCTEENLLSREQFYLDSFNPQYNILKIAGSSLGYKPSADTKAKMVKSALGRKLSLETRTKISESLKNNKNGQINSLQNPLLIKDLVTNVTTEFLSIGQAARELGVPRSTISMRLKRGTKTALKNQYIIIQKTALTPASGKIFYNESFHPSLLRSSCSSS